jgi:hypothetical protein
MAIRTDFLSSYVEALADELTVSQAEKILSTRPNDRLLARVRKLAAGANAGTLTEHRRIEYECLVDVENSISLLRRKARLVLRSTSDRKPSCQ